MESGQVGGMELGLGVVCIGKGLWMDEWMEFSDTILVLSSALVWVWVSWTGGSDGSNWARVMGIAL